MRELPLKQVYKKFDTNFFFIPPSQYRGKWWIFHFCHRAPASCRRSNYKIFAPNISTEVYLIPKKFSCYTFDEFFPKEILGNTSCYTFDVKSNRDFGRKFFLRMSLKIFFLPQKKSCRPFDEFFNRENFSACVAEKFIFYLKKKRADLSTSFFRRKKFPAFFHFLVFLAIATSI